MTITVLPSPSLMACEARAIQRMPDGQAMLMVWTGTEIIAWSGWTGGATYSGRGAILTLDPSYYP